jgi:hypothetical protein
MTSKELKQMLPDSDVPVLLYNNGAFYEWYGIQDIEPAAVIVMELAVYILIGTPNEWEFKAVAKDYNEAITTGKFTM